MSKTDAKAYAEGERAGREGRAADTNPYLEDTVRTVATIFFPPLALLPSSEDEEKASSWAEGHSSGSRNHR